jgi:putative spermidine/putrescine transport system permease protein
VSSRLTGPIAWLLFPVTATVMLFILAPLVVTIALSISDTAFVAFPPRGFTLRWYETVLRDAEFRSSLTFSAGLAFAATLGALLLGIPAGFAVVRHQFPGRGAATAALLSPLIFPVLITGVALLQLFSMVGSDITTLNLLIAHVLVTTPYVVRTVTASLMLADMTLEEAARTLGAGRWRVFRRITVPQIAPGLVAGSLFAFMVSFDNFPISMWLADAQHNPIPLLIFQKIAGVFEPSVSAMSTLMIVFAMAVVLIVERVTGLRRAMAI